MVHNSHSQLLSLGQTAYTAWKEYSKAKKVHTLHTTVHLIVEKLAQGEIAFISAGAGTFKLLKYDITDCCSITHRFSP